jgi:peptide/nickel transport system permease protein
VSATWHDLANDRRATIAATVLLLLVVAAVAGPNLHPANPAALDLANAGADASLAHPLGTDESGRDVLARLLAGGRVSLAVGLLAMIVAVVLGAAVGTVAGYRGGRIDQVLMRITDAALAVPTLFVVIVVVTFLGPTVPTLVIAIGATSWMGAARVVRGELRVLREQPFVEAARALGATHSRVMVRHLVPHLVPTLIVAATLGVGTAILMESVLSFLGLGVQPPAASWGNMLGNAQTYLLSYPRLAIYPGVLILFSVASVNLLGDALRDVLISDP